MLAMRATGKSSSLLAVTIGPINETAASRLKKQAKRGVCSTTVAFATMNDMFARLVLVSLSCTLVVSIDRLRRGPAMERCSCSQ
jgi:hypothetical protein